MLCEVARSQIGCDVCLCMKNRIKRKRFGLLFVIRMILYFFKLAKLQRQTVKFLANEESVTDADRQAGRQTVTFAPLSNLPPVAPCGRPLWSNNGLNVKTKIFATFSSSRMSIYMLLI